METMSSESEQRLHGEHELQMSKMEKSEQNDREIAVFLTKHGDLWLRERDLNPRPPGYEPDELPNCSIPRYKALTEPYYNSRRRSGCQGGLLEFFYPGYSGAGICIGSCTMHKTASVTAPKIIQARMDFLPVRWV